MSQLFSAIKINASEHLQVNSLHRVYVEHSGNPKGIPVLYIHGGPGAGLSEHYRRFFDPQKYWIIGFDQRGCGQSLPFGELKENTTEDLLDDIDAIREHFGIKQWVLFGGSWGSTLALLAAIREPETVLAMILRGVFLARQEDFSWYLDAKGGAAQIFPEYYQEFIEPIRAHLNTTSIVDAYYTIFNSDNEVSKMAALKAWSLWESRISTLHCQHDEERLLLNVHQAISLALLECHYIKHACFIAENQIINQLSTISHIPGLLVHGRYDCVCKLENATTLNEAWKNSQLNIVPESGHSAMEPQITAALCSSAKTVANFLEEHQ